MIDNIKFNNICYMNKETKKYNIVRIIIIFLINLLPILYFTNYEKTYETFGYVVKESEYHIKLNVYEENIEKLTNSNKLTINKKEYTYKVINISEELFIDTNMKNYKTVTINLLEKRNYILNEVLNIKIKTGKEKVLKTIINYLFRKE